MPVTMVSTIATRIAFRPEARRIIHAMPSATAQLTFFHRLIQILSLLVTGTRVWVSETSPDSGYPKLRRRVVRFSGKVASTARRCSAASTANLKRGKPAECFLEDLTVLNYLLLVAHWQYISEIGVKIECAGACAIDEGWPRAIAKVGVSTISTKTRALGRRRWKDTEGDGSGGSQVVIFLQVRSAFPVVSRIYADLSGLRGNNKDARQLGCTTAIKEALIPISARRCLYVAVPKRRGPDCPGPHLHRCKSCTADGREVERGLACDPGAPASPQTRVTRRRSRRRSSTRRISTDDGAPCGIRPASASEPPQSAVLFSLASNLTHRSRAPRSTCADPDVDPDSQSQHLSPTGRRQSIHSLHESMRDADIYFVIVILLSRPSPTKSYSSWTCKVPDGRYVLYTSWDDSKRETGKPRSLPHTTTLHTPYCPCCKKNEEDA
ncbi:hypothetical protein GGX14DRAFT_387976 [Mycena pura]|uniref:Uncharacterized protein n=1 Tax=Mycena pura TaxID=153505 RepID=A0AAD6VTZ9_9AGAR|nr:hypothetical protein GGX14DRAFT_387976 [Mycena pura]